jgi:hypothetical protein
VDQPGYADYRARREATIWQRLNRILFVLLFLALWLVIVSLFVPLYKQKQAALAEIDGLQAQTDEQKLCWRERRVRSTGSNRSNLSGNDRARST